MEPGLIVSSENSRSRPFTEFLYYLMPTKDSLCNLFLCYLMPNKGFSLQYIAFVLNSPIHPHSRTPPIFFPSLSSLPTPFSPLPTLLPTVQSVGLMFGTLSAYVLLYTTSLDDPLDDIVHRLVTDEIYMGHFVSAVKWACLGVAVFLAFAGFVNLFVAITYDRRIFIPFARIVCPYSFLIFDAPLNSCIFFLLLACANFLFPNCK